MYDATWYVVNISPSSPDATISVGKKKPNGILRFKSCARTLIHIKTLKLVLRRVSQRAISFMKTHTRNPRDRSITRLLARTSLDEIFGLLTYIMECICTQKTPEGKRNLVVAFRGSRSAIAKISLHTYAALNLCCRVRPQGRRE